jgi:hypothetical protein
MKTITNRSKTTKTLMRDWDDETGAFEYYWVNAKCERTITNVVLAGDGKLDMAAGKKYSAQSWYGREVRAGRMAGKFVREQVDMSGLDRWTQEVAAGESVTVPTHRETYAQSASRTGQFKTHLQHRGES